ncbi:BioY family transporter [Salimicrobium jeotgali]|uniref:Biotin transporter n=1 Tax=Salimicrobium jeotgali TaxID=1230341 RepID=K2H8A8_9BACI|nr:biotin transporter BioY [Salimicrobium jeotgali]AKG03622.1 BioY family transporter [Salimicrobium jeotgali]EKE31905.1 BioY protein [Salimicrobium jeotgali]MBM7696088.1 biotin transport system substrate-specific component [Salimicrobium jeotgali]
MRTYDITIGSMFVALMAIGANITAIAPFLSVMGVPLTLQTFVAILSGLILGKKRGAFAMFVYTVVGLIGVPVFAGFSGGLGSFVSPTFGFVLSFMGIAYAAGAVVEKRQAFNQYVMASLAGLAVNYLIGVTWLYAALSLWAGEGAGISYTAAWASMLPFLLKDGALAFVAALTAVRLEGSYLRNTRWRQHQKQASST